MVHLYVFWCIVALTRKRRQCASGDLAKRIVVNEWGILCISKINTRLHLDMDWVTLPGWRMVRNYMACWHTPFWPEFFGIFKLEIAESLGKRFLPLNQWRNSFRESAVSAAAKVCEHML